MFRGLVNRGRSEHAGPARVDGSSDVVVVGVGSAGSRIVSLLSMEPVLVDRFAYVTCDRDDLSGAREGSKLILESRVDQKLTPALVRGLALGSMERISDVVRGAATVFVVAGLGGATGSGLSPLVAAAARDAGATTVGVAVMPFEFENKMKFYAGTSLKRLREASKGVIVIDNDTLLRSAPEDSTLTDLYASANREAVNSLSSLLSRSSQTSVPVGLNKLLGTVLQSGYSILGVSSSGSVDKAEEALAGAVLSISKLAEAKDASRAVVMLRGDISISAGDVGLAVKRLGPMMSAESVDVEYGVNYSGTSQLQVSLLASGFTSTKYDEYDPLERILAGRSIDDEMEVALHGCLDRLPSCD